MNKKLLALYGLKWNPFSPEIPNEALLTTAAVDDFCWRIENTHAREGGFALITGNPTLLNPKLAAALADHWRPLRRRASHRARSALKPRTAAR